MASGKKAAAHHLGLCKTGHLTSPLILIVLLPYFWVTVFLWHVRAEELDSSWKELSCAATFPLGLELGL